MKRSGILNDGLSASIAALGHATSCSWSTPGSRSRAPPSGSTRDHNATFPTCGPCCSSCTPRSTSSGCCSRARFAAQPALDSFIRVEFAEAELTPSRTRTCRPVRARAKTIVRTGAFDPWGKHRPRLRVDVGAYFSKDGVTVPESYPRVFELRQQRQVVAWRSRRAHRSTRRSRQLLDSFDPAARRSTSSRSTICAPRRFDPCRAGPDAPLARVMTAPSRGRPAVVPVRIYTPLVTVRALVVFTFAGASSPARSRSPTAPRVSSRPASGAIVVSAATGSRRSTVPAGLEDATRCSSGPPPRRLTGGRPLLPGSRRRLDGGNFAAAMTLMRASVAGL